jgi:hypothetical protein
MLAADVPIAPRICLLIRFLIDVMSNCLPIGWPDDYEFCDMKMIHQVYLQPMTASDLLTYLPRTRQNDSFARRSGGRTLSKAFLTTNARRSLSTW